MIEILVALMFITFTFLPIYNLLSFGQRGTWSNEKEIVGTNYAADLLNFMREVSIRDLDTAFPNAKTPITLVGDDKIKDALKKINLVPPESPIPQPGVVRSMIVQRFEGVKTDLLGKLNDIFNQRKAVPNYLISVSVNYHKAGISMGDDVATLTTIVMD
ncbi:MAG: hypothetical protein HQM09_04625 [Candidatus Riflebacteria bacterium]|nr:hypothetical protein [Candidatus Riflebacteria bacterium]